MALAGKVCVVTGASKGIGRGIALQLGASGGTVYLTGRSENNLLSAAEEIRSRGGEAIPVVVDHSNDNEVLKLFEKIKDENNGRLDVLVNNAYAGVDMIFSNARKKFHEMDPVLAWDTINGVGLRNHYLCTTYASRLMVDRQDGLIVNISSMGGLKYLFNAPYGIGKAACDRMAADCGFELKKDKVTMVSLWPGPVKTEFITENIINKPKDDASKGEKETASMFENLGESIEFAGMAVAHLAQDPKKLEKSGRVLLTCNLAREYGFQDLDGSIHDVLSIKELLNSYGHTWLGAVVPGFVRIPLWTMHYSASKF